jgi:hypothetical protein
MAGQGSVNRRCCVEQADDLASGNRWAESNRGYAVRGAAHRVIDLRGLTHADPVAQIDGDVHVVHWDGSVYVTAAATARGQPSKIPNRVPAVQPLINAHRLDRMVLRLDIAGTNPP